MDEFMEKHKSEPLVKLYHYLIAFSVKSKPHADAFKQITCANSLRDIVSKLNVKPVVYSDEFFNRYYK